MEHLVQSFDGWTLLPHYCVLLRFCLSGSCCHGEVYKQLSRICAVFVRILSWRISGILYIQVIYGRIFKTYTNNIQAYTDAYVPSVYCLYSFVCMFVYVRMCLYNCIIQTLYVRIQTTYVHIRMCTYNILDCCIDRQYTYDIRTYFQDKYEQYTSVYGRIRTVRILFVFVRMCVCICTYVFV